MKKQLNRRQFLGSTAAMGAGVSLGLSPTARGETTASARAAGKPKLLGGEAARTSPLQVWPVFDEREKQAMRATVDSGKWFRGSGHNVVAFEKEWCAATGASGCVATNSGTSALFAALAAVGVSAGDEVIVTPQTFIATVNVILLHHALPIFVDTDPETFLIDAGKIEAAITERTTAILPVHLGGSAADLDNILAIAKKHRLAVVEDACQAHLGEWRGRKLGTWGDAGCFSFQASKNLNCGDGGALITNSPSVAEAAYAFHNNCRGRDLPSSRGSNRGGNFRITEFQAAILLAQKTRLAEQMKAREENAAYLRTLLSDIPGIVPAKLYPGCSRNAYHLFMFRYEKEHFANLSRARFIEAIRAEGFGCNPGYGRLNQEPFLKDCLRSKSFQRLFPAETLRAWESRTACPVNDKLTEVTAWFTQTTLLGPKSNMDQLADGLRKIQTHAPELARG